MSVSNPNTTYPQRETIGNSQRLSTWNELGLENILQMDMTEFLEIAGNSLYWTPVEETDHTLSTSDYRPNYEIGDTDIEGEINLKAARKLLGGKIQKGDSLTLRLVDRSQPEGFYQGDFEVTTTETTTLPETLSEEYHSGQLIATETPTSFEPDHYNFIVAQVEQDYAEDLEDWR